MKNEEHSSQATEMDTDGAGTSASATASTSQPSQEPQFLQVLRDVLHNPAAEFRSKQQDVISAVFQSSDTCPVFYMDGTGVGKSAVYFVLTKLLRKCCILDRVGPTLVFEPLTVLTRFVQPRRVVSKHADTQETHLSRSAPKFWVSCLITQWIFSSSRPRWSFLEIFATI